MSTAIQETLSSPLKFSLIRTLNATYDVDLYIGKVILYRKNLSSSPKNKVQYKSGKIIGETSTCLIVRNLNTLKQEYVYPWLLEDIIK